jgi:hypothetical protein
LHATKTHNVGHVVKGRRVRDPIDLAEELDRDTPALANGVPNHQPAVVLRALRIPLERLVRDRCGAVGGVIVPIDGAVVLAHPQDPIARGHAAP